MDDEKWALLGDCSDSSLMLELWLETLELGLANPSFPLASPNAVASPPFSPSEDSGAARDKHFPGFSVATPQNPPCLLVPEFLGLWQPACAYQLMHCLWVNNKEPLVEPQGCGHTTGIWLQANDICEDSRGCAEGRGLGQRPGSSWRPCLAGSVLLLGMAGERLNAGVLMTTPGCCLER